MLLFLNACIDQAEGAPRYSQSEPDPHDNPTPAPTPEIKPLVLSVGPDQVLDIDTGLSKVTTVAVSLSGDDAVGQALEVQANFDPQALQVEAVIRPSNVVERSGQRFEVVVEFVNMTLQNQVIELQLSVAGQNLRRVVKLTLNTTNQDVRATPLRIVPRVLNVGVGQEVHFGVRLRRDQRRPGVNGIIEAIEKGVLQQVDAQGHVIREIGDMLPRADGLALSGDFPLTLTEDAIFRVKIDLLDEYGVVLKTIYSGVDTVMVTTLPIRQPYKGREFLTDPVGNEYEDGVMLVEFEPGVSEAEKLAIATGVGGEIVDVDEFGITVVVPETGSHAAMQVIVDALLSDPRVTNVSFNARVTFLSMGVGIPNDPLLDDQIYTKMTIPDAWAISHASGVRAFQVKASFFSS